ncbi:PopZ family protein [Pseudorhizobium flavum]|uniref:DUF2497 domain-containing protein n=1 Tax=Pseudorhizobium flavum TaxID=1335061 RepID=A0A7W9YW06_9HYPH|nr:DUF2497 domain-containing protein [Pseudorhizobium flavum]MBB6179353.1 hypothetical protein [Pseudorhizobium flavum]CAD6604736.1 hypothetical protein RFYW14_01622 [Pseudorhizobium flavum]
MAQPSVAREPSMEEILASIRRIIESNEPQAESALPNSMPPVYAEDEIDDGDIDIVTEMAANDRGRPQRIEPELAAETERAQESSLSLADVAARVRAASARQGDSDVRHLRPAAPAPQISRETAVESAARPQPAPMPEFSSQSSDRSPNDLPAAKPAPSAPPAMEPAHDPVQQKTVDVAPDAPASLPARVEALISEEAGAQVARSFNDLAAVFDGIRNRSIEDMAQEMLRPMLQEWLDDNLPTLVERLVREEIERVARGPRR